jgi:hypothetical protein
LKEKLMKTRSAKNKGKRLQNWVRDELIAFGVPKECIKSTTMGESGVDVKLDKSVENMFPFAIECKNVETFNAWKAWEQAVLNTKVDQLPLVVTKKNGRLPMVFVDAKTFFRMWATVFQYFDGDEFIRNAR